MTARLAVVASSLCTLSLLLGCATRGLDVAPVAESHDAETFFQTTSMWGASWSADGRRILLSSDATGVYNVHAIDVDGGAATALTDSTTDATYSQGWFPRDDRFLFSRDQGGNELTHLYVREPSGRIVDLTPGEKLKARFLRWSDDGLRFFVATNERDPEYFDLYEYQTGRPGQASHARRMLYQNPGGFSISEVSRDGRLVALVKTRTNADDDVFLARTDRPGQAPEIVTSHEGDISHDVHDFSPDGRKLFFGSDAASEFQRVWSHDVATGRKEVVFEDEWDVWSYRFSQDGRHLSVSTNADARTQVRVFETATGRELDLPELPAGDIRSLAVEPGGSRLAFHVNGDRSPSNLHVLDVASGRLSKLTDNLSPAIHESELVDAKVVRYPSFDGLDIPALLYRPHGANLGTPVPAVVWVHGGPGGQSRHGYNPMVQHLVNHGYAVLSVNNRGSSGYGKTFYHLDDKRHGDVDLKDCIWGRRYLETLGWVDADRVAIAGGSYGGYMVCAALAFAPEAFDAGVNVFGVTNWLRTLESIPPWWANFRESLYAELGDPATDRERLTANSPLFHASNIVKPMLVVQGANDPRVLQVESDEMVAAVRANGVPVEYLLFPDEGHGFRRKANRIAASDAYVAFLNEHL
ncbi:MAG: alpha/beta fold hydrolase [Acidobacteriota bacterium]